MFGAVDCMHSIRRVCVFVCKREFMMCNDVCTFAFKHLHLYTRWSHTHKSE